MVTQLIIALVGAETTGPMKKNKNKMSVQKMLSFLGVSPTQLKIALS